MPLFNFRLHSMGCDKRKAKCWPPCINRETAPAEALHAQPPRKRFTWLYQRCNTGHDKTMNALSTGDAGREAVKKMDTVGVKKPAIAGLYQPFGALRGIKLSTGLPSWLRVR